MSVSEVTGSIDTGALRRIVAESCGFDPGELRPESRLDEVGLLGFARLQVVSRLEAALRIELPADLVTAIDTVDDLCHFVSVKVDQRGGGGNLEAKGRP